VWTITEFKRHRVTLFPESRVTVLIFFQSNCARRREERRRRCIPLRSRRSRPIFFLRRGNSLREIAVLFTRRRDMHETRFDRLCRKRNLSVVILVRVGRPSRNSRYNREGTRRIKYAECVSAVKKTMILTGIKYRSRLMKKFLRWILDIFCARSDIIDIHFL